MPLDSKTISAPHRLTVNDREIIERRREEYIAAFNREDIAAMTEYAAADAIGMAPNRPAVRGIEATRTQIISHRLSEMTPKYTA